MACIFRLHNITLKHYFIRVRRNHSQLEHQIPLYLSTNCKNFKVAKRLLILSLSNNLILASSDKFNIYHSEKLIFLMDSYTFEDYG